MQGRIQTHPVARVYAQALLGLSGSGARAVAVAEQLEAVLTMLRQDPLVRQFLESPALDIATKEKVLESLRGVLDDVLVSFLCILVEKQRVEQLEAIGAAYRDLADVAAGRVRVHVATAVPLAEDQRQNLLASLKTKLRRDIVLETEVKPELIGGLVIEVGDRVYEGSVHGMLQRLRTQMVRSSGYED